MFRQHEAEKELRMNYFNSIKEQLRNRGNQAFEHLWYHHQGIQRDQCKIYVIESAGHKAIFHLIYNAFQ